MFFSPDLLQKRETGLGLLWLAATLGPKSSFKKLQRRSILAADISKLCNLVSEPMEPISLRLSSNLMVGVVRYHFIFLSNQEQPISHSEFIENEILLTDATNCVASLKRAILDFRTSVDNEPEISVPSLVLGSEALKLPRDAALDFELEFGLLKELSFCNVDSLSDIIPDRDSNSTIEADTAAPSGHHSPPSHLLKGMDEHFRFSPMEDGFNISSEFDDYGFGNSFFAFDENPNDDAPVLGDLSVELARSAGGSWLDTVEQASQHDLDLHIQVNDNDQGSDRVTTGHALLNDLNVYHLPSDYIPCTTPPDHKIKKRTLNEVASSGETAPITPYTHPPDMFEDIPDAELVSANGLQEAVYIGENSGHHRKRVKTCHTRLNDRIQLTDDELKSSRNGYSSLQNRLRTEGAYRLRRLTVATQVAREVWSCPRGFVAPELQRLWKSKFQALSRSRCGYSFLDEQILSNRRHEGIWIQCDVVGDENGVQKNGKGRSYPGMFQGEEGQAEAETQDWEAIGDFVNLPHEIPSSSDPGVGREHQPSRSSSRLALLEEDEAQPHWQDSAALAPWEDSSPVRLDSIAKRPAGLASIGDSWSLPEDGAMAHSPAVGKHSSASGNGSCQSYNAISDIPLSNRVELSSRRFLDYTKASLNILESGRNLTLDMLVPKGSTRRIAADAFYHCLALATKGSLSLQQTSPYSFIYIRLTEASV